MVVNPHSKDKGWLSGVFCTPIIVLGQDKSQATPLKIMDDQ